MLIDVVIVNFRGAADTLEALVRLGHWSWGLVWVVDNSAHEPDMAGESAALRQVCHGQSWLRLLVPPGNVGFGQACNLAFAQSSAEFFLLLNPDARVAVDSVMLLAHVLATQPEMAAVSPRIFWNSARSFVLPAPFAQTPWHSVTLALATRLPRVTRWAALRNLRQAQMQMASSAPFELAFLAGAVMLLRRSAVLAAGGLFDPDYFMFFEDSDLSQRLRRAGYKLAMVPAATAVHEYRHKDFKAAMMARSQGQYFSKLYPVFYRFSGQLAHVARLAGAVDVARWFAVVGMKVATLAEFSDLTGGAGVLAFSPSVLMMPALFRPEGVALRGFDEDEWALLEPAAYSALLLGTSESAKPFWVYFCKV